MQAIAIAPNPGASAKGVRKIPTTARNPSTFTKKKNRSNCKKGARIKLRRENLFHMLTIDKQKEYIKIHGNSRHFHGEIVSGNGKQM